MGEKTLGLVKWLLPFSLVFGLIWTAGCAPASSPRQTPEVPAQEPPVPVPAPSPLPGGTPKGPTLSREGAQNIALNFVRSEATFRFDGIEDTLKLGRSGGDVKTGRCEFEYAYQSRQAGYGDRTGMVLAQVITDHRAKIIMEQGRVVHGVLDDKWDMLKQEMLK